MMLEKNKLTKKYPKIQEGEKIKYTYLMEPNPSGDSAIAMLGTLPKEFKLDEYIDYDRQFEKSFLDPMKGILETIGWDYEKKSTIMDFFS
jgi:DNA polymerase elongation subunit (family B)